MYYIYVRSFHIVLQSNFFLLNTYHQFFQVPIKKKVKKS